MLLLQKMQLLQKMYLLQKNFSAKLIFKYLKPNFRLNLPFFVLKVPMFIEVMEEGSTLFTNSSNEKKFSLRCKTSLNRNLSVLITWLKNDTEIQNDFSYAVRSTPATEAYAGSILEFRTLSKENIFEYQGEYKCRVFFKYVDIGQSTNYLSQPKFIKFSYTGS